MNKQYCVCDSYDNILFSHENFLYSAHEYLSYVNYDLKNILSNGAKLCPNYSSNVYFIKSYDDVMGKKFIYFNDQFTYSFANSHFESDNGTIIGIPKNKTWSLLIADINNKLMQLTSGQTIQSHNNVKENNTTGRRIIRIGASDNKQTNNPPTIESLLNETKQIVSEMKPHNLQTNRIIPDFNYFDSDTNSDTESVCDLNKCKDDTSLNYTDSSDSEYDKQLQSHVVDVDDLNIDQETLKKELELLQELRNKERESLKSLKKTLNDDQKNFSNYYNDINDEKRELRRNREREEAKRRKFEANKTTYLRIREDVLNGKFSEDRIPELFTREYPLYKFMYENNIIGTDDEYLTYIALYDQLYQENTQDTQDTNGYVPHNYHYLSPEEQNKYDDAKNNYADKIESFMGKSHVKPLDEILKELDDSDDNDQSNDGDGDNDIIDFQSIMNN